MVLEVKHTLSAGILAQGTWAERTVPLQSLGMASGRCRTVTDRIIPVLFGWDVSPNLVGCLRRAWALSRLSQGRFGSCKRNSVVVYYCCRKCYFVDDGFMHARVQNFYTAVLWHRGVLL